MSPDDATLEWPEKLSPFVTVGEIMQVRRIYSASAKVRRTLNHQPQTEPTSADEVLPP